MAPPRRCRGCYQNVELHSGCSVARIVVNGVTHERIRWNHRRGARCGDCSTIANGYHHFGCPQEECPVCGRRIPACNCGKIAMAARPSMAEEPYEVEFGKE